MRAAGHRSAPARSGAAPPASHSLCAPHRRPARTRWADDARTGRRALRTSGHCAGRGGPCRPAALPPGTSTRVARRRSVRPRPARFRPGVARLHARPAAAAGDPAAGAAAGIRSASRAQCPPDPGRAGRGVEGRVPPLVVTPTPGIGRARRPWLTVASRRGDRARRGADEMARADRGRGEVQASTVGSRDPRRRTMGDRSRE